MGCSPHVRFEPVSPDDDDYCYIRLLSYDSPRLFHSDNSRTPACSYCRKPVAADWQVMENPAAGKLTCQHCMREQPLSELRWKQDAGMAAFFIEVNSIYPGEAQPVDSFMRQLEQATGSEWRFFYLLTSK